MLSQHKYMNSNRIIRDPNMYKNWLLFLIFFFVLKKYKKIILNKKNKIFIKRLLKHSAKTTS